MKFTVSLATMAAAVLGVVGTLPAAQRPPIVGVANIAIKTDDAAAARNFYEHVLGYQQAFLLKRPGHPDTAAYKVNDHQYVLVSPDLKSPTEDRLIHIAFETKNAKQLRDYLAGKGVTVPAKVDKDPDGNLSFTVTDPAGKTVEFVEYLPGSIQMKNAGKFLSDTRVSDHMMHVGIRIGDPDAEDKFYKDILDFRLMWKGGPSDTRFAWISMMVPDGPDWVEYMVNTDPNITPNTLGVLHHFAVDTLDIQAVNQKVIDRGYKPTEAPKIARDGRWQINLYDPNHTRAEVMIRKPVQPPCCSPINDPY